MLCGRFAVHVFLLVENDTAPKLIISQIEFRKAANNLGLGATTAVVQSQAISVVKLFDWLKLISRRIRNTINWDPLRSHK